MLNKEEYNRAINIPLAVIIASFIIIVITTGMTDSNGLSALIGGYSGLLLGLLFIVILNFPPVRYLDMMPFVFLMCIISLFIYYLSTYFEQISTGNVSGYYKSFSILSTMFLAAQMAVLFSAMFKNDSGLGNSNSLGNTRQTVSLTAFGKTLQTAFTKLSCACPYFPLNFRLIVVEFFALA